MGSEWVINQLKDDFFLTWKIQLLRQDPGTPTFDQTKAHMQACGWTAGDNAAANLDLLASHLSREGRYGNRWWTIGERWA